MKEKRYGQGGKCNVAWKKGEKERRRTGVGRKK